MIKLEQYVNNPVLFMQDHLRIRDQQGLRIPFEPNHIQIALTETCQSHNKVIAACARQQGISTIFDAYALWKALTQPGSYIFMADSQHIVAQCRTNAISELYYSIPGDVVAASANFSRREIQFDNGSKIIAQSTQSAGIFRGIRYDLAIIDHFAWMRNNDARSLLALATRIPQVVITSCGDSGNNAFNEAWWEANTLPTNLTSSNGEGINGYFPFFSPWWRGSMTEMQASRLYNSLGAQLFANEYSLESLR